MTSETLPLNFAREVGMPSMLTRFGNDEYSDWLSADAETRHRPGRRVR